MTDERRPENRYPDDTYLRAAAEEDARLQPDPELGLSGGRAGPVKIWVVSLIALAVIGLVMYGLTQGNDREAAQAPAPATTGAGSGGEPQKPGN